MKTRETGKQETNKLIADQKVHETKVDKIEDSNIS
jgi:hypothetical protein